MLAKRNDHSNQAASRAASSRVVSRAVIESGQGVRGCIAPGFPQEEGEVAVAKLAKGHGPIDDLMFALSEDVGLIELLNYGVIRGGFDEGGWERADSVSFVSGIGLLGVIRVIGVENMCKLGSPLQMHK